MRIYKLKKIIYIRRLYIIQWESAQDGGIKRSGVNRKGGDLAERQGGHQKRMPLSSCALESWTPSVSTSATQEQRVSSTGRLALFHKLSLN